MFEEKLEKPDDIWLVIEEHNFEPIVQVFTDEERAKNAYGQIFPSDPTKNIYLAKVQSMKYIATKDM